jgi:hypothetical protein
MSLMVAGTRGIVGIEVMTDRVVGLFPRRGLIVMGPDGAAPRGDGRAPDPES